MRDWQEAVKKIKTNNNNYLKIIVIYKCHFHSINEKLYLYLRTIKQNHAFLAKQNVTLANE